MQFISRAENFADYSGHFNRLYDSLVYPLWASLSKKYIPPLSSQDLEDIFQEAWINLLASRKKYRPELDVYNWIYIIKKNLIIDKIRKMKKAGMNIELDENGNEEGSPVMQVPEPAPLIEDDIIARETREMVVFEINNIGDLATAEILRRRIILDQKLEQISNDMEMPMTTVHKKLKAGINLLRPKLENILLEK